MLRVEQSHFFPEISVGYTRQDILPLKNLNAWMIGVSFPIYFLPQKSKVKQARLTATSAQIQADANILELRNKTLELEASLRRYNESLRYYTSLPERSGRTDKGSQPAIAAERNRHCRIYTVDYHRQRDPQRLY